MKSMKIIIAGSLIAAGAICAAYVPRQAATQVEVAPFERGVVDSITVESALLPQPMRVNVALPAQYAAQGNDARYPTVYLLNGHGGSCNSWSQVMELDSLASAYGIIFVAPSGMNSWYFDAPERPEMQMESFVTTELVPYIDSNYRTQATREGRAITGFSMGGHGALWLALRHPDLFSKVGSSSGGVDFTAFPKKWNIADALGAADKNPARWRDHTVMSQLDSLTPGRLMVVFDCGTDDFFYPVNCRLDSALNARKIPHTYITSPGTHNAAYWSGSFPVQVEMFSKEFGK